MISENPQKRGHRSPDTISTAILVVFTDHGDAPLDHARERKGRPERSPSLPPVEESKPESEEPTSK